MRVSSVFENLKNKEETETGRSQEHFEAGRAACVKARGRPERKQGASTNAGYAQSTWRATPGQRAATG